MLRVGLTGGIGAGKSTVTAALVELGAVVIDADRVAREVVEPGTEGLARIVERFGEVILRDGRLDRGALAATVFGDDEARAALNAIVHPLVRRRSAELLAAAPADAVVLQDIPLLVENDMGFAFHLVVVVDAPQSQRVQRLVSDRGMSEADAAGRIRAQATDAQRRAAADVWLDNSGAPEAARGHARRLWDERLVPFEANIRRRTWTQHPPNVVPSDPTWPQQAHRLIGRLAAVLGQAAVRIDHIGSTAVPGLAAKDTIDLQVTVRSLEDADTYAAALSEAGFVRHVFTQDTPKPEHPDLADWQKRLHVLADPGRAANVHIRVDGSPGQRFALIFRDWLRASPEVVAEYLAVKRSAQVGKTVTLEYAEAKEPWFEAAYPRALTWATATGWAPS